MADVLLAEAKAGHRRIALVVWFVVVARKGIDE
jgi:hypothetical protein